MFVKMCEMEIVQEMGRSGTRLVQPAFMGYTFVKMFEMEIFQQTARSGTRLQEIQKQISHIDGRIESVDVR